MNTYKGFDIESNLMHPYNQHKLSEDTRLSNEDLLSEFNLKKAQV